jgi:PAS domain S-box-containing protein
MKIFSHIASRRNRRTIAAVCEVKKEIPVGRGALSWKRFYAAFTMPWHEQNEGNMSLTPLKTPPPTSDAARKTSSSSRGQWLSRVQSSSIVVADSRIAQVASGTGWVLVALGLTVLVGWAFHVHALISVVPSLATMKVNTAVAFLLTGAALLRRYSRDLPLYGLGVLVIGTVTLAEYLSNSDFGIDQLLLRDPYSAILPGRMSSITSLGFLLLGPALLLMKARQLWGRRMSRSLGLLVGSIGFIALLGYSYDTQALYQVHFYRSVALNTALAFVIAAIGVQCVNPGEGMVRQIHANSAGGAMLRQLLPAALLIPFLLGFTAWLGHKHLGWELGFSMALVVAATTFCLVTIMLRNARHLEEKDLAGRRATEAVRESEGRFRLVANTAPVMIWMSGPDKLCTYFNQPWLEFTGRLLEAELGNGWAEGVHPEDLRACLDTYTRAFDRHESFRMRYRLRRNDGEYRWILDTGVPRLNGDGSFAGFIGSCVDVTDLKLAEEALSGVSRKLIEAHEQERTRIARELHDDVNQRIALLAMELERFEQNPPDSTIEVRRRVHQVSQRISELGTDIQALSHRLHSSKLEYLGIAAAARGFCKEFSEQQKVVVDFAGNDIPRTVPQEVSLCLFRILQEALQNAVKHSGVREFKVELRGAPDQIQLTVSDGGVGFEPKEAILRQGLGLISMQERLHLVKGAFSIESQPGRGTTIRARVPLKTAEHSLNVAAS